MNINVHVHYADRDVLEAIASNLKALFLQGEKVMAQLDALTAQVQKNTDVEASAVLLIQGIAAELEAAKTDPAKIQELADNLKVSGDALAAAVAANTEEIPGPAPTEDTGPAA